MPKLLALLASLALLFGACGSDDDDTPTTTEAGAAADDESTSDDGSESDDAGDDTEGDDGGEDATDPEDQARLDDALDTIEADLTARGYSTERTPASDDDADDDDALEFESAECQEADEVFNRLEDEYDETAESDSLDASRGEFTGPDSVAEQLNVELTTFASGDDVSEAFDTLDSVPLADCMQEAFESQSDEDFTVEVESVDVTDGDRGDRELIISIAATFSGDGLSIPVDLQFHLIGTDRDAVFFGAFAFNSSTSDDALAVLDTTIDTLQ